jgi:hypothetical protein
MSENENPASGGSLAGSDCDIAGCDNRITCAANASAQASAMLVVDAAHDLDDAPLAEVSP